MKKRLPILLILQIFCIASFAQEKKPTKQETMDWIADKMKTHLNKNAVMTNGDVSLSYDFESYEKGTIKVKKSRKGIRLHGKSSKHMTFQR